MTLNVLINRIIVKNFMNCARDRQLDNTGGRPTKKQFDWKIYSFTLMGDITQLFYY